MNPYRIISYTLFLITAMEIILGVILFRNNPRKSNVQRAVTFLSFISAAFAFTSAFMYLRATHGLSIDLAARFNWVGWFTVPAALQIVYFLKEERGRTAYLVGIILYPVWLVILGLCLFTELIVATGYSVIPFINAHGPLEPWARLFGSLLAVWLLFETIKLRKELRGHRRAQLNYFFQGVLIFGSGAAFTAGFLQLFGGLGFEPGLASLFSLPWVALTYYAMTRHRLFDIRIVLSRALSISLLLLVLFPVQLLLLNILSEDLGNGFALFVSLLVTGLIFFGTRLNRTVQGMVQRLIMQDRYDYQAGLLEAIKAVNSILDLNELLDFILDNIKKSLLLENVCLAWKGESGWTYRQVGQNSSTAGAEHCWSSDAVLDWLWKTGHVIEREEMERTLEQDRTPILDYMKLMQAELIVPLLYKGDLKGFIILGQKGTGHSYVQSDLDLLELLANQAAVAIENARLFEETRRAKELLLESEEKFRTLADTAAVGIFIHQGGNFLYTNRTGEIIGGYTREEYLNLNFMSLTHPDYIDLIRARARERLSGGQPPLQYEFKIIRKDGNERWVLMTAGVTTYEGKPAVIGTLIDITTRKEAEEARERLYQQLQIALQSLKDSESRFRTLAETTSAGIIIYRKGKLIYVNRAGEKLTGHNREKLLAMPFTDIIHPHDREMVRQRAEGRLRGENVPQEYEYTIVTRQGEERWISMTAGVIEYEGGPVVIATLFDITDRKRAEEETVNLYEQRIAVEKRHIFEKEKILMDLHDGIGGITTNISILSELAQKSDDIKNIKNTLATISRLSQEGVTEIRSFMHSLDTREMTWRTLATELKNQGANMVEPHKIEFNVETSIETDTPEQPGSLLWVNLFKIYKESLTNVIKHAKAGCVTVTLSITHQALVLKVHDNGIGWNGSAGSGRGLSNMQKRALEIGGQISVDSGQGTRVLLEIPLPIKYSLQSMDI